MSAFRLTHALLEARARSISLRFKWRIAVSAPAAIAGASEVVKMKPGA
jgi:hypothetical protein